MRSRAAHSTTAGVPPPSFGELLGRLGLQARHLFEQKVALARAELGSGLRGLARDTVLIAVGALVALLGVVHLFFALALWIGDLLGSLPGGFAVVGAVIVALGAIAAFLGLRGLQTHSLVPEQTVTELRRDVAWIKNEL
jgi:hypothetical protein